MKRPAPAPRFASRPGWIAAVVALVFALAAFALHDLRTLPAVRSSDTARPAARGSDDFRSRIALALDLLASRDPDDYRFVLQRVRAIREDDRSGSHVEDMSIALARPTYAASTTWLASVLVHESQHLAMYADYEAGHPGLSPPADCYTGVAAERTCNERQLRALERVDAPTSELDWMRRQDGSHFDLNGNGVFDEQDYLRRNW